MRRDSRDGDTPNWWLIGLLVVLGMGLLAAGYYMSSYWQSIFVNGGTALFLSAVAVFFEPRLMRHLQAPRTLEEALARFSVLVGLLPQGSTGSSAQVKDHVLRLVGRTGLHQDPPEPSVARFVDLSGSIGVKWCIQWDDAGLVHYVTLRGRSIPLRMRHCVGWNEQVAIQEDRVYKILCYLLRELESSTRS